MGAFENVTDKLVLLLNKTRDSLLLDLEKEFSGIRTAMEQLEARTKGSPSGLQDGVQSARQVFESCTQVVKATFAQVGLDISHCENTEDFTDLLGKPFALLEQLAEALDNVESTAPGEVDYSELAETLYKSVQDLMQLVRNFQDVEFGKISKELEDLLGEAYEQFNLKELVMSLLEYIFITLLRNGREVFADEIKYVKFQANEIYTRIDTAVKDVRGTIEGGIQSCLQQFEQDADKAASMAKTLFRESVDDLESVYDSLTQQVKDGIDSALNSEELREIRDVYEKISGVLSKMYAILDFFGLVGRKTVEIKLPKKFISALESASKTVTEAIENASEAIGGCVHELTENANGAISYAEGAVKAVAGPVHDRVQQAAGAVDSLMDTSFASLDITTDLVNLPAISIPDFSEEITSAGDALSGALAKYVGAGIDYAKGFSFPITIPTFRWEKVEKMFTDPAAYFVEQYPVDSVEDAEAIAAKVLDIARLFNPDIPDFSSLRNLLESLLRELGEKVLTLAQDAVSEAKQALWEQVKPLMTMIRKVLDLLEEMYESLKREAHNVIQEIKRRFIQDIVNPLSQEASGLVDSVKRLKEQIERIQAPDTVEKLYEDIIRPAVEEAIEKSTAPGPETAEKLGTFAKDVMTAWGTGVYTHLTNFFDEKAWKDRLENTISALEATFAGDVAAVKSFLTPSSLDDLRNMGGRFRDLKKSLDISEYIKIVSEAFDNVSIPNPELYFEGFKQAVTAILGEARKFGAKFDESQVTTFASDVATAAWTRFRDQLLQPLFRELKKDALTTVRQVVREVIDQILDQLPSYKDIKAIESGSEGASGTVRLYTDKAEERITDVKDLTTTGQGGTAAGGASKATVTTSTDKHFDIDMAKDWLVAAGKIASASAKFSTTEMSYADVITLVVSLYKAIPESAKEYLEDLLPSLPDNDFTKELSGFFEQMDYKGDLDNTFAIVTVVDAKSDKGGKDDKEKDKKKEDGKTDFNASALLQLVVFAGEIPVEKEKSTEKEQAGEKNEGEKNEGVKKDAEKKDAEKKDGEKKEEEEKEPALFFRVILKGQAALTFAIGENHTMSLSVAGGVGNKVETIDEKTQGMLQSGIGFHITKDWEFHGDDNWEALNAMFLMDFKRKAKKGEKNRLQVFDTKYISLDIENYPQLFYLGFAKAGPTERFEEFGVKEDKEKDEKGEKGEKGEKDQKGEKGQDKGQKGEKGKKGEEGKIPEGNSLQVGYIGALRDARIMLHLQDVAFVKEVVTDDIAIGFDTYLWYDYHKGFDFGGDVRLHLEYDLNHKKLGPLTIETFTADAGPVKGEKGKLALTIGTTFQVNFCDALVVSVEDLGVGFKLNYRDEQGDFGDYALDAGISYPTGVGITVDASVVKGGGQVSLDRETNEFFGYLFLEILEKVSVKAVLLCDPGTAEGHFFSLFVLLSALFNPGVPLGMGFSLTAVGGTLGLNRRISRDAIQNGVRTGSLGQVFFVGDPEANLAEMKGNVISYFPPKEDQFFFGLLGQISFEPLLKCDFGLLLQLPAPTEVIIVGAIRVKVAGGVLDINSYFAGGINFSEGMWFDSSLVNSQIVGISISGDMAFRLNWGGQKGFLLSMGGFHPAYHPEEGLHAGKMNRLAMRLEYDILNVSFEHYLAVTSNTFQIGARLDLKVGWKEFCITGYAGFDTLFQFNPFLFQFAACAGAHVVIGTTNLLHTTLNLGVQGPAPWIAVGTAHFKLLGIKVDVDFSLTWGKRVPKLPSKVVEVFPLLVEEWNNGSNWHVDNGDLTGKTPVSLFGHASSGMILQPDGSLTFNQSAVPFYTEETTEPGQERKGKLERMDLCNDALPADYDILRLEGIRDADGFKAEVNDFAPALYRIMTIQDKLSSESYVKYNSGFTLDERDKRTFQGKAAELTRETSFRFCSLVDQRRELPGQPGSGSLGADTVHAANGRRDRTAFERYVAALDKRGVQAETTK